MGREARNSIIVVVLIVAFLSINALAAQSKNIEKKFNNSKALSCYKKGDNYTKEGLCEKAITEYNKAIKIAPNYYGSYAKLGHIYYCSGRFEEALGYFRKSFSINRDDAEVMRGLGKVYMALNQENEACIYFEKAMAKDPNSPEPYLPLAIIYNHKKRFDDSIALLKVVLDNYPRLDSAYFTLAQDYESLKNTDMAIENYKKAAALTPGYVKARVGLARCYMNKGLYNRSYSYAKSVYKRHPDLSEAKDIMDSLKKKIRADKKKR